MPKPLRSLELLPLLVLLLAAATAQAQPGPPDPRQAAIAFEQQGNVADAETAWQAVLKAHPASAEAYAHLGLLQARQQKYKEAVPLYRKAMALNPTMPSMRLDIQLNLGLALFKAGEPKAAIAAFQPLLAQQTPGSPQAQRLTILLGMAHYGMADYAAASRYLKAAAACDPGNLELHLALAHSCLWSKQYQCVLDAYHQMLLLNAESAEVDMLAGEAEDAMKNYDGAIAQFRAAIKANPNQPEVHFGLGYILWTQRQYPEAATEFQAELANNPGHAQALAYLADADMQMNHAELAPPLLQRAVSLAPKMELPHLDLGILATDAGRTDDALRELASAVKLAPDDVNAHWRLGRLYRTLGRRAEATAEFDKANKLHKATNDALLERMNGNHAQPPTPAQPPIPAQPIPAQPQP